MNPVKLILAYFLAMLTFHILSDTHAAETQASSLSLPNLLLDLPTFTLCQYLSYPIG